ncbi:MAG: class I SAM-dependent methyltransferase [Oscillospiraceae bacterium]|nr:class I SAM-dependent methyltransferase [Oscillospiraceae bacterium]
MADIEKLRREWLAEEAATFQGWDFSRLDGRMIEEPLPWDYGEVVKQHLRPEHKLLDMHTGGGEILLSLNHPHKNTCVTEGYQPNYELCVEQLAPLGITVRQIFDDDIDNIPYDDNAFDVVLNKHGAFDMREVDRVLKPGGVFITQQVGQENNRELTNTLIGNGIRPYMQHDRKSNQKLVESAGFAVIQSGEHFQMVRFLDVGAAVYCAKIIEWEFPGFSVERFFDALLNLQNILEKQGYIEACWHRFFLVCERET